VRLWDAEKGEEIDAITNLEMTPWSAGFSPDGKRLAIGLSAGPDGEKTLRIWTLIAEGVRAF
jgi:WD40 repeat protein